MQADRLSQFAFLIAFAEGHCASVAAAEVCDCAWCHRCCLVELTDAVWMAFIEWAWWPGRITGADKDLPSQIENYLMNRRLNWNCPARMTRIELGRIPSSWLRQEMSSPMARLGLWEGGQVGKWMNSLLFQLDFKRMNQNQVSSMIQEMRVWRSESVSHGYLLQSFDAQSVMIRFLTLVLSEMKRKIWEVNRARLSSTTSTIDAPGGLGRPGSPGPAGGSSCLESGTLWMTVVSWRVLCQLMTTLFRRVLCQLIIAPLLSCKMKKMFWANLRPPPLLAALNISWRWGEKISGEPLERYTVLDRRHSISHEDCARKKQTIWMGARENAWMALRCRICIFSE